jgi:hypothetical protein
VIACPIVFLASVTSGVVLIRRLGSSARPLLVAQRARRGGRRGGAARVGAVERVAAVAAVAHGVLLDAAADLVKRVEGELHTWKGSSTRVAAGSWSASAVA